MNYEELKEGIARTIDLPLSYGATLLFFIHLLATNLNCKSSEQALAIQRPNG